MGNKSSFRLHSQLTSFFSSSPEKSGSKCELSSTESGHSSKCDQSRGTKENGVDSERYIVQYSMCSYSICRLVCMGYVYLYIPRKMY